MKLTKDKVCVFIENEAQLRQAKKILKKYAEPIYNDCFFLSSEDGTSVNFLKIFNDCKKWSLSCRFNNALLTLPALEVILKNQGDIECCEFCNTVCTIDEMRQDEEGCWFCDKCLESIF